MSRVESRSLRNRQSTAVSSLVCTTESSVDEHEFWWRPPPEKLLPSSRQLEYCCCLCNSQDTPTRQLRHGCWVTICPSAPRVALCHLQHHGTPFTRDKAPYQSATSPFDDQNVPSTSTRPSHEIGRHVCSHRPLLTDC